MSRGFPKWFEACLALSVLLGTWGCGNGASTCVPACRAGFVCVEERCVSACNPPCAAGEVCSAEGECVPAPADAGALDANSSEVGPPDAGLADAPSSDAAPVGDDARGPDDAAAETDAWLDLDAANEPDAAVQPDAASFVDAFSVASENDAGIGDAGRDAGVDAGHDASLRDAGHDASLRDAGRCGVDTVPSDGGCLPYATGPYGSWTRIADPPSGFWSVLDVWTGSHMLVVPEGVVRGLGDEYFAPFLLYDPSTNTWSTQPATGGPRRGIRASYAWTGRHVAVWGGYTSTTLSFLDEGGLYDPETETWTTMTRTGAPAPRQQAGMVWAGDRLVVFGGIGGTRYGDGGEYDPVARVWTALPSSGAPSARVSPGMVWTGRYVVVWGGCESDESGGPTRCTNTGARYDVAERRWLPMAASPLAPRGRFAIAWTGREVVIWGGANYTTSWAYHADGARYDPEADRWTMLPSVSAMGRRGARAVFTGVEVIVWGGWRDGYLAEVGRWVAALDAWRLISVDGAPPAREAHAMVWTGTELVVAGGRARTASEATHSARWRP